MHKIKFMILSLLIMTALVPIYSVTADTPIWDGSVSSDGTPVTSITSVMMQKYLKGGTL